MPASDINLYRNDSVVCGGDEKMCLKTYTTSSIMDMEDHYGEEPFIGLVQHYGKLYLAMIEPCLGFRVISREDLKSINISDLLAD